MSPDALPHRTAYDALFAHPSAPTELLAIAYWAVVGDLQKRRGEGENVDDQLHHLTRSYELVADAGHRSSYNASIGFTAEPLTVRRLPPMRRSLRSRLLRRAVPEPLDLYEVMGVSRDVPNSLLADAHRVMRDNYIKLNSGTRRAQLLRALEAAYATLISPDARERYDTLTSTHKAETTAPPAIAPRLEPPDPGPTVAPEKAMVTNASASGAGASLFRPAGQLIRLLLTTSKQIFSLLLAGCRLAYRAVRRGVSAIHARWSSMRSTRAERRVARAARPTSGPSPTASATRVIPSEVENKFLDRVASSVQESESHVRDPDARLGPP